jgi:hypothetical protein
MKGKEITIYVVHESFGGVAVTIASAVGTMNGSQFRALPGANFGEAFRYARRLDMADVERTPEAAVKRYVTAKRSRARALRVEAALAEEMATAAQELIAEALTTPS